MIKKLLALSVAASLLAGCGTTTSIFGVANPISNNTLGTVISTYGIVDSAVIAYRGLPRCTVTNNFSATNICYKRSVLVQAQVYDAAANKAINQAVQFQRDNPTLDASAYIEAATAAVDAFKAYAVTSKLPGVS